VRRGTEGIGGMPSRLFHCADEAIVIVAGNNEQFARLCEVLGCGERVSDPRFATVALRGRNRQPLGAVLEPAIAARKAVDLPVALENAGLPAGPVCGLAQVFDDRQVRARGLSQAMLQEVLGLESAAIGRLAAAGAIRLLPISRTSPAPAPARRCGTAPAVC